MWGPNMKQRKDEHLLLSLEAKRYGVFKTIELETIEPCGLAMEEIDTGTSFMDQNVPFPSYINAITGGGRLSKRVNERLAMLAQRFQLPMMTGSMHSYLSTGQWDDYAPIRHVPMRIVNLSARATLDEMKRCLDVMDTPYLCLHLNTMQELLQKEGRRDFRRERENIEAAQKHFGSHLMIKAVGQGFSPSSLRQLQSWGIETVDISGSGGTDFSRLEQIRKGENPSTHPAYSTEESLQWAVQTGLRVVASGGLDRPLDWAKALALGAEMTASAYYYLKKITLPYEDAIATIERDRNLFRMYMMITGSKRIPDMNGKYMERKEKPCD